jgi:hypothetical protein
VEAMLANGPLLTDPRNASAQIVRHLESIVADSGNATSLRIKTPSISIDLRKASVSA